MRNSLGKNIQSNLPQWLAVADFEVIKIWPFKGRGSSCSTATIPEKIEQGYHKV
jgi:hypothetical protein